MISIVHLVFFLHAIIFWAGFLNTVGFQIASRDLLLILYHVFGRSMRRGGTKKFEKKISNCYHRKVSKACPKKCSSLEKKYHILCVLKWNVDSAVFNKNTASCSNCCKFVICGWFQNSKYTQKERHVSGDFRPPLWALQVRLNAFENKNQSQPWNGQRTIPNTKWLKNDFNFTFRFDQTARSKVDYIKA